MSDTSGRAAMASRFVGSLEHPTRRRMIEHLLMLPGDHFRSIVRSVGIGVGTAHHHLRILQRGGLVYEQKSQGRTRYYVAGDQDQCERNAMFGRQWVFRELRARVWTALAQHGESSATRIASLLGITRQLAAYHLRQLEARRLVLRADGRYRVTSSSVVASDVVDAIKRIS